MVDGAGSHICDGEIEEPLCCGGHANAVGAEAEGEDLAVRFFSRGF